MYSRLVSVLGCILWRDISFLGKFLLIKELYFEIVEKFKFISEPELPGPGSGMISPDPDPS